MSAGQSRLHGSPAREPHGLLPPWPAVLAVVAHPDDESFGLGAIIDKMTSTGAAVHVLCYTRGEASTLNQTGADLIRQRARELRRAGAALGVSTVALLDYPDGRLAAVPAAELAAHAAGLAARYHPSGLLVFDDTGITGHPDHRAATAAAVRTAGPPDRRTAEPACAGLGPACRHRRPPASRDRPAVRRPGTRAARLRHPGQPGPAAAGRAAACQPGFARSAALAAAGAARRRRAPALARASARGSWGRVACALRFRPGLKHAWQYLRRSWSWRPSGLMDTVPGYGKLSGGGAGREAASWHR
jgi:LmbE family N-acetylglucosaminyl deacetylase